MSDTTVFVSTTTRDRLNTVAKEHRIPAKQFVDVLLAGWQFLTPEQQHAAITHKPVDAAPIHEAPGNPAEAAVEVACEATGLVRDVVDAMADKVINESERSKIITRAKRLSGGAAKVSAAVASAR